MTEEKKITEEQKCSCPISKFFRILIIILLLGCIGYCGYIYFPQTQSTTFNTKKEETQPAIALLQKADTWFAPLFENKKSKLQELPKEFSELKELLEFVYYRMDSYLNSPQANKTKILEELKQSLSKNLQKETTEWIDARLVHFKVDLNQPSNQLQKLSSDVCTYACIVYKKAIPILQDFFKK